MFQLIILIKKTPKSNLEAQNQRVAYKHKKQKLMNIDNTKKITAILKKKVNQLQLKKYEK